MSAHLAQKKAFITRQLRQPPEAHLPLLLRGLGECCAAGAGLGLGRTAAGAGLGLGRTAAGAGLGLGRTAARCSFLGSVNVDTHMFVGASQRHGTPGSLT
jgi:hypothetical protein